MKLLNWNIQWGRGMDGRVGVARILRTIHQLGDFDVICLQEVAVNRPLKNYLHCRCGVKNRLKMLIYHA